MTLFIGVAAALCFELATATPQCLNPFGQPVDYWLIFKHPTGTEYAYADSNDKTVKTMSDTLENDSSPLSRTLIQAYRKSRSQAHAFWNDEWPSGHTVGSPWAHAKGAVVFDTHGGFWLTHSVPKFPNPKSKGLAGSWETASTTYAQNFFCIAVTTATLKTIGQAMLIDMVSVYDSSSTTATNRAVSNFRQWTNINGRSFRQAVRAEDASQVFSIQSAGNTHLALFAKSAHYGKDLWQSLVAPKLSSSLVTETWMNGHGNLPSECNSNYQVLNSKGVVIAGASWKDSQDHSKWGVAHDGHVLCMGDINRQEGQFVRGGGAVCIQDSKLGEQMKAAVTMTQNCAGAVTYVTHSLRSRPVLV